MDVRNDHVPQTQLKDELAALTGILTSEAVESGQVVLEDEAPTAPASQPLIQPQPAVEAAPAPAPAPAPVVEAQPEPVEVEVDVPTFKPHLDDEIQALLEEPDFDEEARAEVAAEIEDSDEYEYGDPEQAAKVRALEKRNKYLEERYVASARKNWVAEAKRVYPDLDKWLPGRIEKIQATSRKAFLRAANEQNVEAQTVFGPALAELNARANAISQSAVQVAREEVAASWGRPSADTLPPAGAATKEALERARAKGDLTESLKVLMEDIPVL